MFKKSQQSLIEQLVTAINKGEKSKFVVMPCQAEYLTPEVFKAITVMVNTGKMVPIGKPSKSAIEACKVSGEKRLRQLIFRTIKQDEDGDDVPETLRGEVIGFCGEDADFAEAMAWIHANPPQDSGESPDESLQGDGYPVDLWRIVGGTLAKFDFEEDGELSDKTLKKYKVDSHEYVCPPDADEAGKYALVYVFCKRA